MKKFNEWLSFRSNSYNETESHESDSAFEFGSMPGSITSGVRRAEGRFKGMISQAGDPAKMRNKRVLLADLLKDIYDFADPTQLPKLKNDLRYLLNRLQTNNNLENIESDEDEEEETEHEEEMS